MYSIEVRIFVVNEYLINYDLINNNVERIRHVVNAVSNKFNITLSERFVRRMVHQHMTTGNLERRKRSDGPKLAIRQEILNYVEQH